jgi:putative hydrolase of the HAD superfamily
MIAQDFWNIGGWVFDLDNTLYPPAARLFEQIDLRMTDYIVRELRIERAAAERLRHRYWRDYGTTLAGLMQCHGIDPEPYLIEVHEISFDNLTPDPELAARIRALPGRRIVYTNGSAPYAHRVLEARGLSGLFDGVYGVENAGFRPKPERSAFEAVFAAAGIAADRAAMFEDDPRNLQVPHSLGMRTVHVAPAALPKLEAAHIHHHTADLGGFLHQI